MEGKIIQCRNCGKEFVREKIHRSIVVFNAVMSITSEKTVTLPTNMNVNGAERLLYQIARKNIVVRSVGTKHNIRGKVLKK